MYKSFDVSESRGQNAYVDDFKRTILDHLWVLGYRLDIVERDGMIHTDGRSGSYAPLKDEIHIDKDLTSQKYFSTIMHEMGEVIVERLGLAHSISHDQLTIIMEALSSSLQSNPELLAAMLESSKHYARR